MTILDTHTWIWWVSDPARLGKAARRAVDRARTIGIPSICCLEVSVLAARGRIRFDRPTLDWIHDTLALPHVELMPITPAVAVKAAELPASFPGDPADRLIVATAVLESAALVTKDERIQGFAGVRAIW